MKRTRLDVKPIAGLDPQIGLLLSMLDDGTREWRQELGRVSNEAIGWQSFPNGHSIGTVILHISDVEGHWIQEVAAGQPRSPEELKTLLSKETDQDAFRWPKPPKKSLSWFFEQHDRIRQKTHQIVKKLADPEYLARRDGRSKSYTFTLRWILHHVLTHEAYHGGQAVLLAIQLSQQKGKSWRNPQK